MASGELFIPVSGRPDPRQTLTRDAAGFGLKVVLQKSQVEEEFFLWPENLAVFNFWLSVQTQWLSDSGTRTGLNYAGIESSMNMRPVPKRDRPEYFRMLQGMELAALEAWSKKR